MIRPIFFTSAEPFNLARLKLMKQQAFPDVTPGQTCFGPEQCILQNAVTQIHMELSRYNGKWDITSVPHVTYDDVVNNNHEPDCYFEMPTAFWFSLKDRSVFKGKNVIITNYCEAWIRGLPLTMLEDHPSSIDLSVIDDMLLPKHCILVRDNNTPIPNITCIPHAHFYGETRDMVAGNQVGHDWMPWCDNYMELVEHNIANLPHKTHTYTALLGWNKPHRTDMHNLLKKSNLKGYYGGFADEYKNVEHDNPCGVQHDRFIAEQWTRNSQVWVSMETHVSVDTPVTETNICSSLTEKTWKPIMLGMPFLMNNHPDCISYLEDMGFNAFTEVFGNYIDVDYVKTNKNIVHILENFEDYDITKIQDICRKNFERFCEHDTPSMHDTFMARLGISYN